MARVESIEVLVDGLDHPEGVAFDHGRGVLYAGGEAGQIYAVDPEDRAFREIGRTPGFVLGLAVDGLGRVVVCDSVDGAIWVLEDGQLRRLLDRAGGRDLMLPNYPAFGPDGTLYFSDSGAWKQDNGAVVAVAANGVAEVIDQSLVRFTNGCAVTPDGSELWVIQSLGPDVSRIDLAGGGPAETVVRLPGTVPDGVAFTSDGGAIISCYRPDRIYYLSPEGRLEVLAEDPEGTLLAAPTNICFLGGDRKRLVSANLGRWHLTLLELDIEGVIPHAPQRWAADVL
ncbi:MAG: SMP-30/gluconolactonase/LRE family protein [Acidimicrobiia bacterium]|nr:SMP-30/gluconolactonase/LRE family protein [Acidimicrobiia bacterium]